jgi:hypothetical protein
MMPRARCEGAREQEDEGRLHDPNLRRESDGHHETGVV